jgi:hypothetical protein
LGPSRHFLIALWTVSALGFAAFVAASVPRLTNYNSGDIELSGWTGFVATRLTAGERPYVDFVTPIGPASLLLRSALERMTGELRLFDELLLIAGCRFLLALLAYAIAVTVTSRTTASLVAIATLALLLGSSRDNAFEVLGQLAIWASLACGARALRASAAPRKIWWIGAGACSALALGFDARCAVAAMIAWILLLGFSAFRSRELLVDLGAWGRGAGIGLGLVLALVLLCGSTPLAFAQSVLGDGLTFAGGTALFAWAPLRSALTREAYSSSLLLTAGTVILAAKLVLAKTPDPAPRGVTEEASSAERAAILGALIAVIVALGCAVGLLLTGGRALPRQLLMVSLNAGAIAGAGILLGCFYVGYGSRSATGGDRDNARALSLLFGFALVAALLRDPWLFGIHPTQGGDALTAVALIFVFLAAQKTGWPLARPLILALALCGLFGLKLHRALDTSTLVRTGYWSGLRVNHRGLELLAASRRVRELTRPQDTVLVVPEDPEIAALIGRPRPHLRGSIVFSNHYPARLLESDRSELDLRPPRVVVIHPRRPEQWQPWLVAFSPHGAATVLSLFVSATELPRRYRLDSTYRTTYVTDQGALEIWLLDEAKTRAARGAP